jgi:hypothetical protein
MKTDDGPIVMGIFNGQRTNLAYPFFQSIGRIVRPELLHVVDEEGGIASTEFRKHFLDLGLGEVLSAALSKPKYARRSRYGITVDGLYRFSGFSGKSTAQQVLALLSFLSLGGARVELATPSVSYYLEALSPVIYIVTSGTLGAAKSIFERTIQPSLFTLVYHGLSKVARKEGCILGCISLAPNANIIVSILFSSVRIPRP